MTVVVLGILAIVWVAVLGSYAKDRYGHRHQDSVSAFRSQLKTLKKTQPNRVPFTSIHRATSAPSRTAAHWRSETARLRRRNVLLGLLSASALSFVFAVSTGSSLAFVLTAMCALALAGYVALLVNQQRIVTEQQAKVRRIHPAHRDEVPAYAVARR